MKVLLYSHVFFPSVGGIESVSIALAQGFLNSGVECIVVTKSVDVNPNSFPFKIFRNPDTNTYKHLLAWADVVLCNGVSLSFIHLVVFSRKPFVWIHANYQVSCIDGLGWVDGEKAPLTPFASVMFHLKNSGFKYTILQGSKLFLKRFVALYLVTKNVAITDWVKFIQPLPRQVRIYNPFPIGQFVSEEYIAEFKYDFLFLGRLVSEKGVSTLLKAFAKISSLHEKSSKLLIIGDGNWRGKMEALASELNVLNNVTFVGSKTGKELVDLVSKAKIAVIPSEWYEPMGGVAIELMAAGKRMIVSKYGGLKECVGNAGISFENGNPDDLAECMLSLLTNEKLCQSLKVNGDERIKSFAPQIFVEEYITMLKELVT